MCAALLACTLPAGCAKSEMREASSEMTLRPVTAFERGDIATKADPELAGTTLGTDNTYVVYTSASNSDMPLFLTGQLYSYCSTMWRASSAPGTADPVYWPTAGEPLDFLAYACTPAAQGALGGSLAWDAATSASGFKITGWDLWAEQHDVMYAAANGVSRADNSGVVDMTFRHSCALVCFTASGSVADAYTINGITINGLAYSGDFTVDNSRTELTAGWSNLTTGDKAVYGLDGTDGDYAFPVPATATQCAQHLLVIEQPARSLTLKYTMRGSLIPLEYTVSLPRTTWKAGRKYTYAIEITPTEILASPAVTDWDTDITGVVI